MAFSTGTGAEGRARWCRVGATCAGTSVAVSGKRQEVGPNCQGPGLCSGVWPAAPSCPHVLRGSQGRGGAWSLLKTSEKTNRADLCMLEQQPPCGPEDGPAHVPSHSPSPSSSPSPSPAPSPAPSPSPSPLWNPGHLKSQRFFLSLQQTNFVAKM